VFGVIEHSDDALLDHAYLVARGVRPLALIGSCAEGRARVVRERLDLLAEPGSIPFQVPNRKRGWLSCGYAGAPWVVDLLRWVLSDECPVTHQDRIMGLLCGYSTQAIQAFEETYVAVTREKVVPPQSEQGGNL
jgi:hypothetical protein